GTLGIRVIPTVHRLVLGRRVIRVPFSVGDGTREIEVKIGSAGETVTSVKPEFEQARRIAGELGVPVREVLRRAEEAAREIVSREGGRGG
ncbi:MAG TPA: nickel insertion protein, partial [Methanomicrobiales archaeon]|nr:nickel insertion protein [Methanomicrobiales archaeon]